MKILIGRSRHISSDKPLSARSYNTVTEFLRNPNTTEKELWDVIHDKNSNWFRSDIPEAAAINEEMLEYLSHDRDNATRTAVARNTKTPAPVLDSMSDDMYYGVIYAIIDNPNTSIDTLKKINDIENYGHAAQLAEDMLILRGADK